MTSSSMRVGEIVDWEWMKFKNETESTDCSQPEGRIGVVLIGLGRMGIVHLKNLLNTNRAKLLYCFDADRARLDYLLKSMYLNEFGVKALHTDDLQLALDDPQVKSVIVVSPTIFHEEHVRRSLNAGKNVLCEKPLTIKQDQIVPLYELAREKRVYLSCAFNRLYDPEYRDIRQRSVQDRIGSIQLVRVTARECFLAPLSYIKLCGGLFRDTILHNINMCIWITRQLPDSVQVVGKTFKEFFKMEPEMFDKLNDTEKKTLEEIDDFFMAVVTLKFPDGSIGVIDNSRQVRYGYDHRLEVTGSKATLRAEGRNCLNTTDFHEDGVSRTNLNYNFISRYKTSYEVELSDFLNLTQLVDQGLYGNKDHLKGRILEPVRPTLVIATHKTADACAEASKSDRSIEIKWDDKFVQEFSGEIE